ncbi:hypothetical protein MD484_g7902, partial [Candolleomyces efflorescens]
MNNAKELLFGDNNSNDDLQLRHERLCHHNTADIQKLVSGEMATGITLSSSAKRDPICEPCLAGKMHSSSFPSTGHRAAAPLDLIHSDLSGPMSVSTPEGSRYWVTFIDDHTRFRVVMLLKRKSGVFSAFQLFKALAENQLGRSIKALHDDKGGEYMSNEFNTFCDSHGILRRHTTRNRPQQNGDAERANRTMNNDVTAMLAQSKLPMESLSCSSGEGLELPTHISSSGDDSISGMFSALAVQTPYPNSSTLFSLEQLDKELAAMVLIRALPEEYNTFVSSLLDKLDKSSPSTIRLEDDYHA